MNTTTTRYGQKKQQLSSTYYSTYFFLLLIVPLFFFSNCSLLVNGTYQNEESNFEIFFEDLRSTYAYAREYTKNQEDCSLDELYNEHKKNVSNGMGELAFAAVLLSIERTCNDIHFWISNFSYETRLQATATLGEVPPADPNPDLNFFSNSGYVRDKNLTNMDGFSYGIFESNVVSSLKIGFIRVNDIIITLQGASRLEGNRWWLVKIEDIIKKMKDENVASIIVDIRTSAGGSMDNGRFIAARFMNTTGSYIRFAEKTSPSTFQNVYPTVEREGTHTFTEGKIVLLTNRQTCSGAEMFSLAMRKRENLIQVGYPTLGCTGSILEKDLPNGLIVRYTSSQSYCIEKDPCSDTDSLGSNINYFRRGINPDFGNTDADWITTADTEPDEVLENAINLLEDEALFERIYNSIERHQ